MLATVNSRRRSVSRGPRRSSTGGGGGRGRGWAEKAEGMHMQEEDIKALGGLWAILASVQVSSATCDVPDHRICSETSGRSNPQDFPLEAWRLSDGLGDGFFFCFSFCLTWAAHKVHGNRSIHSSSSMFPKHILTWRLGVGFTLLPVY